MKVLNLLLGVAVSISVTSKALAGDSIAAVESQAKVLLLQKIKEILPPYIEATDKTIADILKKKPKDSTRLSKFYSIFKKHASILDQSGVFGDTAFAEGRVEEDVAWLKASSVGLKELQALVDQSLAGANVDTKIDKLLNNLNYRPSTNKWGLEVQATLLPVSRFYCNVGVSVTQEPGQQVLVYADETCD